MPEPSPAKTKMSMEMNSAKAAFRASGRLASDAVPMAILEIGIFQNLENFFITEFKTRKN